MLTLHTRIKRFTKLGNPSIQYMNNSQRNHITRIITTLHGCIRITTNLTYTKTRNEAPNKTY